MEDFNNRLSTTEKLISKNQKIKSEQNVQNKTLKDRRMENRKGAYKKSRLI